MASNIGKQRRKHIAARRWKSDEVSCKIRETKDDMNCNRGTIPQDTPSASNHNSFVGYVSPKMPHSEQYVQLSNIINPWRMIKKIHFLSIYFEYANVGKTLKILLDKWPMTAWMILCQLLLIPEGEKKYLRFKEHFKYLKNAVHLNKKMTSARNGIVVQKVPQWLECLR